ncbi:MAG TPA: rhodanese-like domain-containing protein [Acidimicrobiia bacterium]
MTLTIDGLLTLARAQLERVAPEDLGDEQQRGALVIDIRPEDQRRRDGPLPGALVIDRNVLEWRLAPSSLHRVPESTEDRRVILVCNEGFSSSLAAATLHMVGVTGATDLIGGFQAWATIRAQVESAES